MLDAFRNAAKGWVAKVLIGLLAMSFAVWGIADVFRAPTGGALATVGEVEVTAQEYSESFNQYLQNLARQTGQQVTPDDARKFGIDRAVLNNLIQSAALDNQARSLKLGVPDAYIAAETSANPAFQDSSGKFDPDLFRRLLAQNGMSEGMYLAQERQGRLRDAITDSADGNIAASGTLTEIRYRHANEQRDARYFVIRTLDSEVPAPTDDEIKKEYEANPSAYTAPEYRSIAIMKAEPADLAAKIELSEDDLKAGYEKYRNEYLTPERRTILQLSFGSIDAAMKAKDRLAAGEDFLAIAKELGFAEADVTFADKTKGEFIDPAIADAAFALAEGAVSEPVKGMLNTVLLKAVKVSPEHQSTLDEVRAALGERLKLERANEEIQSIYDVVEDARAAQTKFEEIAEKSNIPFQLVSTVDAQGLGKDGAAIEFPHKADVLRAAFTSDVGVENSAISLDNGYVWYEVREVVPSAIRPFEEVKAKASAAVLAAKVRALSEEKAKKLVERATSGISLDDLAKESQSEIKTVQGLKRAESGADFDAAAVKAVFSVAENGITFAVEPDGKGAKVIQSQAVLLPPFDANSAEAKSLAEGVKEATAADVLAAYLGALQKDVGVTIDETLWRQISGAQTQ